MSITSPVISIPKPVTICAPQGVPLPDIADRRCEIVFVTPDIAKEWLAKYNKVNREIKPTRVQNAVAALVSGNWSLTAESIAFSKAGPDKNGQIRPALMINGQHRLTAIVQSGIGAWFTVWWNCEFDEFSKIDQNGVRTQPDLLRISSPELEDPTNVAVVITQFRRLLLGHNTAIQNFESDIIRRHYGPEIVAVAKLKRKLGYRLRTAQVAALFGSYVVDAEKTTAMVERMCTKMFESETDPMMALHDYTTSPNKTSQREQVYTQFYKALSAFISGLDNKPRKNLKAHPGFLGDMRRRMASTLVPLYVDIYNTNPDPMFFHTSNRGSKK